MPHRLFKVLNMDFNRRNYPEFMDKILDYIPKGSVEGPAWVIIVHDERLVKEFEKEEED